MPRKKAVPVGMRSDMWDTDATEMHRYPACAGCKRRPDPCCSACGKQTAFIVPAGDNKHVFTWCRGCWKLVREIRAAVGAPPIVRWRKAS